MVFSRKTGKQGWGEQWDLKYSELMNQPVVFWEPE